jgi:hypothetical protein|tara:strand:- start:576 stop:701 length:126 start_codon:yes stop_codon:yes gene_type:complete
MSNPKTTKSNTIRQKMNRTAHYKKEGLWTVKFIEIVQKVTL